MCSLERSFALCLTLMLAHEGRHLVVELFTRECKGTLLQGCDYVIARHLVGSSRHAYIYSLSYIHVHVGPCVDSLSHMLSIREKWGCTMFKVSNSSSLGFMLLIRNYMFTMQ